MSAPVVFHDLVANWPLAFIIYTHALSGITHQRTHVHTHPTKPDVFALVRIAGGKVVGIGYVTRAELAALAAV